MQKRGGGLAGNWKKVEKAREGGRGGGGEKGGKGEKGGEGLVVSTRWPGLAK